MEIEDMQMIASETFGELVERRRADLGLSQGEAAERCGCSQGMWSEYEAGRRVPHATRVPGIAAGLGVDEQLLWSVFRQTKQRRRQQQK